MSENNSEEKQAQFGIQRIYLLDVSFEIPDIVVFKEDWKPEVNLDLATENKALEDSNYQVVLSASVTVKIEEKVAFIVEIKQAGIFFINAFPKDRLHRLLGAYCPEILFPYMRETIANLISRGSFPPLHLAPVNFDALYTEQQKQKKQKEQKSS